MSRVDRLVGLITSHRRTVIAVVLVVSLVLGSGAAKVDQSSSLDQFQGESTEAEKLEYIEEHFGDGGDENTTTVQVIVRDDNVLSKQSLLRQLRFQQRLHENATVNESLSAGTPPIGIANVIATTAIRREQATNLQRRGEKLKRRQAKLEGTAQGLTDALNRTRELQHQYDQLNRSLEQGEIDNATYRERAATIESKLSAVQAAATKPLSTQEAAKFAALKSRTRSLQRELDRLNASYAAGNMTRAEYRERAGEIRSQFRQVYRGVRGILAEEFEALQQDFETFQADRKAFQESLESGERPTLQAQIAQVRSMNHSALNSTIMTVLGDGGGQPGAGRSSGAGDAAPSAFVFMPTSYEPGSTSAAATMMVVTQAAAGGGVRPGSATERLVRTQTAIKSIADDQFGSADAMVFGAGVISDEIDRSMQDSLLIVGPLALLFVLVVRVVAYRDLLDILLGFAGIVLVLVWTFGFMGWAGIAFNQIFVAVPVLLIGLSIDYAIHVFMRHREERMRDRRAGTADATVAPAGAEDVRGSMRIALGSVGVALTWVTATTVIGFLSNLTSAVPPIREFGVVSSFGIVSALVVFGGLVPAVKVSVDGVLEERGIDRRKRAFGTGGGRFNRALAVGTTLARRAPVVVLLVAILVSAGGTYGATQVDTSFEQSDFLADDPPDWMDRLPEPFDPGEYSAKDSLTYVNEHFLRQDSRAQILVEGKITGDRTLERLHDAQDQAAKQRVTVVLSNGEADIRSPLTVMERVAASNESFNQTFHQADTDGNGVPDRNLERVYDRLYTVAPDAAGQVIHREDGDYRALRMVVSVKGGASSEAITTQMRAVAAVTNGQGLQATATGRPIVFELVQDSLLQTVIQSLLVTLVAVFLFLMATYRVTDGSATLGFLTLLPVVLSVTWILGTMYLAGIPFNVLTGMITSLTVGLGVAYSIHISERYVHELGVSSSVWEAMERTVVGTGGALLGSAATTVGGFGVLVFAVLPPLQQFGLITGLTIIYAFLAAVLVLPSLLAIWTTHLGPGWTRAGFEWGVVENEPMHGNGSGESEEP